jgi:hypothetical protein
MLPSYTDSSRSYFPTIAALIATGEPTRGLYFADPSRPGEIQTEVGTAVIFEQPAATDCAR